MDKCGGVSVGVGKRMREEIKTDTEQFTQYNIKLELQQRPMEDKEVAKKTGHWRKKCILSEKPEGLSESKAAERLCQKRTRIHMATQKTAVTQKRSLCMG